MQMPRPVLLLTQKPDDMVSQGVAQTSNCLSMTKGEGIEMLRHKKVCMGTHVSRKTVIISVGYVKKIIGYFSTRNL